MRCLRPYHDGGESEVLRGHDRLVVQHCAAAQILAKSKEPMGCKDIVEQALAQKLWSTSGKTPAATLYAAIIREISTKGKQARFEKVDRGRFQIRKGA